MGKGCRILIPDHFAGQEKRKKQYKKIPFQLEKSFFSIILNPYKRHHRTT